MLVSQLPLLLASGTVFDSPTYDALRCKNMRAGQCADADGGAWGYRSGTGDCMYTETTAPQAAQMVRALPRYFPRVESVLDFGGGPGIYLTGFRDQLNLTQLFTVEPHPLGNCVFRQIQHLRMDIFSAPPLGRSFDLVMSLEVAEHIPTDLHARLIEWLLAHTRRWLVFSAAHPGQPGAGHTGNKAPSIWRGAFLASGQVTLEEGLTDQLRRTWPRSVQQNLHVFQRNTTAPTSMAETPGATASSTSLNSGPGRTEPTRGASSTSVSNSPASFFRSAPVSIFSSVQPRGSHPPSPAPSPPLPRPPKPVAVFIHCALLTRWQDVLDELVWSVHRGGLIELVTDLVIVAVGADLAASEVGSQLTPMRYASGGHAERIQVIFSNESIKRYELPTLTALHQFAGTHPGHLLLYMHTKGVGKVVNHAIEDQRSYMIHFNARCFGACVALLSAGAPSCGVDLVTAPQLHFSGNYWWVRADRAAVLPAPNDFADLKRFPNALHSWRHNQEFWVAWRENASRPASVWHSGINIYERHLHRYPESRYKNEHGNEPCT